MQVLAERLKWLRENKRYGQKEVASEIGVTLSGYQKMEYSEANPKIDTLIKLAEFYNVSSDFLLGLSNEIKENNLLTKYEIFAIEREKERITKEIDKLMMELEDIKHEQVATRELLMHRDLSDFDRQRLNERNRILNSHIKNKKADIVFNNVRKEELDRTESNLLSKYIDYLMTVPCAKSSVDEVIQRLLPINVIINDRFFGEYYIALRGKGGVQFTFSSYKTIEEAKEAKEKLDKFFNDEN